MVAPGAPVLGYDVGPANALLDAAARRFLDRPCDVDGARAAAGRVHEALLARLLAEPLRRAAAQVDRQGLFHGGYLDAALSGLGEPVGADDVLATLTELTARTVADACDRHRVAEVVAAGGECAIPHSGRGWPPWVRDAGGCAPPTSWAYRPRPRRRTRSRCWAGCPGTGCRARCRR
ncbi:anhydro-N-acetylmuramic acid kinase [Micromonospora sp. BRA006-A]|nr:anhydro-N-acetylmuramic acid kinase [Micromonospora sp. BRA006-A]